MNFTYVKFPEFDQKIEFPKENGLPKMLRYWICPFLGFHVNLSTSWKLQNCLLEILGSTLW
jgi:hypothetical protein